MCARCNSIVIVIVIVIELVGRAIMLGILLTSQLYSWYTLQLIVELYAPIVCRKQLVESRGLPFRTSSLPK